MSLKLSEQVAALESRVQVDDACMKHLNALYCALWAEACYDPVTEETGKFARGILPHIQALNEKLKFKR